MTELLIIAVVIGLAMTGWAYFTYLIVKLIVVMKLTEAGYNSKRVLAMVDGKTPRRGGTAVPVTREEEGTPDDLSADALKNLRRLQDDPIGAVDQMINDGIDAANSVHSNA